jgi:hypothetical protein
MPHSAGGFTTMTWCQMRKPRQQQCWRSTRWMELYLSTRRQPEDWRPQ